MKEDLDPVVALERVRSLPDGARVLEALADVSGVHLVGGAVRDLLLGGVPRELDLVAEDDGPAVARALGSALGGEVRAHVRFGTATVDASEGLRVDVATARAESYPAPGALPVVRPGTLADDMARRDFTANAIAVGVSGDRLGEVHQADGALDDLAARRLRVLHDASFADDPTRLLRLVRYAARLGFAVEASTERLAREAIAAGAPATAGAARMGNELLLLLAEPLDAALQGLEAWRALGAEELLDIDPEVARRAVALLPDDRVGGSYASGGQSPHSVPLLLAVRLRGVEPGRARAWLEAIHVPDPSVVLEAARDPDGLAAAMRAASAPSELHRLLRGRSDEAVALAGAVGAEHAARRWFGELRGVRLAITGDDLLAAGVPHGREVGARLDAALARKLDAGLDSRDAELAAALDAEL